MTGTLLNKRVSKQGYALNAKTMIRFILGAAKHIIASLFRAFVKLFAAAFYRLPLSFQVSLIKWASERHTIITLFYFYTGDFFLEQRATFVARFAHELSAKSREASVTFYRLRRSIHRIEKGLIMRPLRRKFAEEYIEETVDNYMDLVAAGYENDPQVTWAASVLGQFFSVTDNSTAISAARLKYENISPHSRRTKQFPYMREKHDSSITYDALLKLAHRRRSVRWYLPKRVPREIIDNAIDIARWSPSACNRQPFDFRIFDDPELVAKVAAIPMGITNYAHNIPCIAVLVGHVYAFPLERDRHVFYIDASLAAMSFEFALEVQGVSSCSINWPNIHALERRLSKLLGLNADERVVMLISFGYPDPTGKVPFSEKKPLESIRSYNRLTSES